MFVSALVWRLPYLKFRSNQDKRPYPERPCLCLVVRPIFRVTMPKLRKSSV